MIRRGDRRPEADARITWRDLGIWKNEHIEMLARIASFLRSQGSIPGIQLAHAGRKASTQVPWDVAALPHRARPTEWLASRRPQCGAFPGGCTPVPRALTAADIHRVVEAFAAATAVDRLGRRIRDD